MGGRLTRPGSHHLDLRAGFRTGAVPQRPRQGVDTRERCVRVETFLDQEAPEHDTRPAAPAAAVQVDESARGTLLDDAQDLADLIGSGTGDVPNRNAMVRHVHRKEVCVRQKLTVLGQVDKRPHPCVEKRRHLLGGVLVELRSRVLPRQQPVGDPVRLGRGCRHTRTITLDERVAAALMVSREQARQLALALPEAVEQDHHGRPSFRVSGKIFATLWDQDHMNVMLDESGILTAIHHQPATCAEVWWGKRLAAVRVDLRHADSELLAGLLADAWEGKAPKRLLSR